jgi:NADPH:quinone reductase
MADTMKALICPRLMAPDALEVRQIAKPEPEAGEIRLRVAAASVNFPDVLMVQGQYQVKPPLPFVPGCEAAGIVDAVGVGVTRCKVGDRVLCIGQQGAFAEYMIAPPSATIIPLPQAMPFAEGAALGIAYGTTYHAFVQRTVLRKGETVLVLGAAGGVGLAAVQMAKAFGAAVIAGASTDEKLELARANGADATINYTTEDLKQAVKKITDGRGVDVIYDPVGGKLAEPAMRSIAWDGRYLVIGFASGTIPALPLNLALIKNASIIGVFWGGWSNRHPDINQRNFAEVMRMVEQRRIAPRIDRIFSLNDSAAAIRRLMDGQARGKVVVQVGGTAQ